MCNPIIIVIFQTSKLAGYGDITISDSEDTRVWEMHADLGYRRGWHYEDDLVSAVEEWFGFITSYTATETTSEAILSTGVSAADAVVTDIGTSKSTIDIANILQDCV